MLIRGLGMGFSLRAALDHLAAGAVVIVSELDPTVVRWRRGPIAHLTSGAVQDPRVAVVISDVAKVIRDAANKTAKNRFAAFILDLAVALSRQAFRADGAFAV